MLFDPGRIRQAEWTMSELPDTAPAYVHDEGSPRLLLSGLNHTTFDLAVYASQDGSPHHHARLASGCWSSFARRDSYPQGFNERFQSSSLFLLSKACLTQGHLYQGRFQSLPVAEDDDFLMLCRYVEANTVRGKLVERAEQWRWCGLWRRAHYSNDPVLSPWPVERPGTG